jgi:hypothetical protein
MDATRKRRTKDRARQAWYACCRQQRFARFLGFGGGEPVLPRNRASQPGTGACRLSVPLSRDRRGSDDARHQIAQQLSSHIGNDGLSFMGDLGSGTWIYQSERN